MSLDPTLRCREHRRSVHADERQFGLVVDGINDTEEIVVKPLGKQLKGIKAFAGSTIMGDGRVALILDVLGIAQSSNVSERRCVPAHSARKRKRNRSSKQGDKADSCFLFTGPGRRTHGRSPSTTSDVWKSSPLFDGRTRRR